MTLRTTGPATTRGQVELQDRRLLGVDFYESRLDAFEALGLLECHLTSPLASTSTVAARRKRRHRTIGESVGQHTVKFFSDDMSIRFIAPEGGGNAQSNGTRGGRR